MIPADRRTADSVESMAATRDAEVRPLRRDAADNRRRLLAAAETVFAAHGLDAPVEEIARVAGVGMGTLYRRFPTKDALITELVRELLTDVLRAAREALAVPGGDGLEQFLGAAAESHIAHRGCLPRLWSSPDTDALRQEVREVMLQLFLDAQEHRRVRADADISDVDLVLWSLSGVIETTHGQSETAWRRGLAIIVAGLRPAGGALTEPALSPSALQEIRGRTPTG